MRAFSSSRPLRLGVSGCENSHVDDIACYVETGPLAGAVAVAAVSGDASRRVVFAERLGALDTGEVPAPMLGLIDALIVCERDGASHCGIAEPFLERGVPVLVDKPFACSVEDAARMVAAAHRGGTTVTSGSPLRYMPAMGELARQAHPDYVEVAGPADPDSPWGGLHFYGSHHTDLALRFLPGPVSVTKVERTENDIVAWVAVGRAEAVIRFRRPQPGAPMPFTVSVEYDDGGHTRTIDAGQHVMWPALTSFIAAVQGGTWPIADTDLIRPVALVNNILDRLATTDEPSLRRPRADQV